MKNILLFSFLFVLVVACGKKGDHAGHAEMETAGTDNPNQALYQEALDIHDEVMPKMDDLFNLKKSIVDKIEATPAMAEEKKAELRSLVVALDSANDAMMDWMHKFNPVMDSTNQEAARAYLETEIERIKKVRDLTNETIEKAKKSIESK